MPRLELIDSVLEISNTCKRATDFGLLCSVEEAYELEAFMQDNDVPFSFVGYCSGELSKSFSTARTHWQLKMHEEIR